MFAASSKQGDSRKRARVKCLSAPVRKAEYLFEVVSSKKGEIGPSAHLPLDAWKTEVFRIASREPEVFSASRRPI